MKCHRGVLGPCKRDNPSALFPILLSLTFTIFFPRIFSVSTFRIEAIGLLAPVWIPNFKCNLKSLNKSPCVLF